MSTITTYLLRIQMRILSKKSLELFLFDMPGVVKTIRATHTDIHSHALPRCLCYVDIPCIIP